MPVAGAIVSDVVGSCAAMSSRRELMRGAAAVAAGMTVAWGDVFASVDADAAPVHGYGPLRSDPAQVLDLPEGFSYRIISRAGETMDDGLQVPGLADGMHAFRVGAQSVLVRNHELNVGAHDHAFAGRGPIADAVAAKLYDSSVGAGGTTTLVLAADGLSVQRQFLSLAGTLRNCAGGATPWGTWLSCEESVVRRGEQGALRDHGYVFEVPAAAPELIEAQPLIAMGRFNREAVAVDPDSGIVYQSEDRPDGLFYRFIPQQPGRLAAGGRLQAMKIDGFAGQSTANRRAPALATGSRGQSLRVPARSPLRVTWVDLNDVESANDDLRHRGRAQGATTFVRGEGLAVQRHNSGVCVWLVCTEGGARDLGQLWRYQPMQRPASRSARSDRATTSASLGADAGTMELFLEPSQASMLHQGDNLAMAPNDDVLVCEDHRDRQRVVGVTASGGVYTLARNPRGDSELAGACFAPAGGQDGGTVLYLNIQSRGLTLAITGPWSRRDARPR
jgi:secreted PhoX family phosphatase